MRLAIKSQADNGNAYPLKLVRQQGSLSISHIYIMILKYESSIDIVKITMFYIHIFCKYQQTIYANFHVNHMIIPDTRLSNIPAGLQGSNKKVPVATFLLLFYNSPWMFTYICRMGVGTYNLFLQRDRKMLIDYSAVLFYMLIASPIHVYTSIVYSNSRLKTLYIVYFFLRKKICFTYIHTGSNSIYIEIHNIKKTASQKIIF